MGDMPETRSSRSLRLLDRHRSNRLGERADLLQRLKATYFLSSRDERFNAVLEQCLDALSSSSHGTREEAVGIVLLGDTGAGKSNLVRHGIRKHPLFAGFMRPDAECAAIGVRCLGAYNLRVLATHILHAAGYPVGFLRENVAWIEVRQRLEHLGVMLLWIDEVNNVLNAANRSELKRILNAFKALLNHPTWPVVLILSGTPDCEARLRQSGELSRRMRWMSLDPLTAEDLGVLRDHLGDLFQKAGLGMSGNLLAEVAPRLVHAANRAFGTAIDLAVQAAGAAVTAGATDVTMEHFAEAYAERTQATADANPFAVRAWSAIVPCPVAAKDEEEDAAAWVRAAALAAKGRARQGIA